MSRSIKFRGVDKRTGTMVSPIGHFIEFDGSVWFNDSDHTGDALHDQGDNIIIMQWTGLYDKNGVEIWEGDIWQLNPGSFIGIVEWKYSGWNLSQHPKSPCISYPSFYSNAPLGEVTGNIHQPAQEAP